MSKAVTHITFLLAIVLAGCSANEPDDLPASYVQVVIDKDNPKRLLTYYLGGYVAPTPADPFEAGIAAERNGRLYVNLDSLARHYPQGAAELADQNDSRRIEWEEFESFIDATYYKARSLPVTVDSLREVVGFDSADPDWMRVEVDGVMTTARRIIFIRQSAIADALRHYHEHDQEIIYPVGTTIIGDHYLDGRRAETTVMSKREDGYWDFFVYGADETLAASTSTPPKELKSPIQCVGCHFGNKLFEPEESFPVKARPGPHGPRVLYVSDSLQTTELSALVRYFDEHRKRSDTILGLYSTLFVAKLQAQKRAGTLSDEHAALLESFDL